MPISLLQSKLVRSQRGAARKTSRMQEDDQVSFDPPRFFQTDLESHRSVGHSAIPFT